jgi:hypothetical protein
MTIRRIATLSTLLLLAMSSPLWAQCQSYSLPFDSDQGGTLDAADCSPIPIAGSPQGLSGPAEYWTIRVEAGDRVTITTRSLTVPIDLIVEDPDCRNSYFCAPILARSSDLERSGQVAATFSAPRTAIYRVIVRSDTSLGLACCGTYVIRASVVPLCPGPPLYWQRDESGELRPSDAGDCLPLGLPPRDIWTLQLNQNDYAVVTLRSQTLVQPALVVLRPSGVGFGGDEDPNPFLYLPFVRGQAQVAFRAPETGTHRVIVTSFRPDDLGPYSIRVDRVTTPIFSWSDVSVLGNQVSISWATPLSPTTIVNYELLVGSAPGREDLVRATVGTVTRVVGLAPPGLYYIRVRAHNAAGFADSPERAVVVGPHLSAPGELLLTAIIGRRVTLSWSPPATPGTAAYELVVGSARGRADVGTFNVGNVLTVAVDAVPPGTYYVRVRAVNAQGPGAPSNEVVVTVF